MTGNGFAEKGSSSVLIGGIDGGRGLCFSRESN